jgi:hypothetical protein
MPAVQKGAPLDWGMLTAQTIKRAQAQLAFSENRRYREPGIAKGTQENFCALIAHETGQGVSAAEFEAVCTEITQAFEQLAAMSDLWKMLLGRRESEVEKQIWVDFEGIKIMVQLDLVFERSIGHPTIIDWKSYDVGGDTDARLQTLLYGWALWKSELFGGLRKAENIELLECQVLSGALIQHECSLEIFDELEDHIYRSIHRIFPLCRSKKLTEVNLRDFAFTDNPTNCEHCTFRTLCLERTSDRMALLEMLPSQSQSLVAKVNPIAQPMLL